MAAGDRLRIVLADDHPQVLEEIRDLLNSEFDVVDVVDGGIKLVEAVERARPDAVVSDITMPDLDGIQSAQRILSGDTSTAIVMLTMHNDPHLLFRAIEVGIRGFILKVDAGEELIDAVRAASLGATYVSRSIRTR